MCYGSDTEPASTELFLHEIHFLFDLTGTIISFIFIENDCGEACNDMR